MTQSDRVHDAIRDSIMDHAFPAVTYTTTASNGKPGVRVTSVEIPGTPPTPAVTYRAITCLVKPTIESFREPLIGRQCGGQRRERDLWEWTAIVTFAAEVSWESFVEARMGQDILLPRSGTMKQVRVYCAEITPQFPPEQNASSGTRLVMRWLAEENLI